MGGSRGNDGNTKILEGALYDVLRRAAPKTGGERGGGNDKLVPTEAMPALPVGEAQKKRPHEGRNTEI